MRSWKQIIANDQVINSALAALFFFLGGVIYFLVYQNFPHYLTNDSAVEVMQIIDFKPWPIHAFIPSYNYGSVGLIESFYGYFMQPFIGIFGKQLFTFKLALGVMFAATSMLFFVLTRRLFSLPTAVLISAAYVTSAYTIWWPLLLLRNGFCPLWVITFLLGWLDVRGEKPWRGIFIIVTTSLLAIDTYSTFKVVTPALFLGALFVGSWENNKFYLKRIFISCVLFLIGAIIFFVFTDYDVDLLWRGNYMLTGNDLDLHRDINTYLLFLARSFFLPVYENPDGFLAEPTHFIFGRSMLNPWIYALWFLGLGIIILKAFKKEAPAFMVLVTLLISSIGLCIGGPSLKTHFALVPLEFIIIAYAINWIVKIPVYKKVVIVLLSFYIAFIAYAETQHMFGSVRANNSQDNGSLGQDAGLFLSQHSREFDFVIYATYGVDLMRLFYPNWIFKTEFIPMDEQQLFYNALMRNKRDYNRLWLIVSPQSPFYEPVMQDKNFCFKEKINNMVDTTLLVKCVK